VPFVVGDEAPEGRPVALAAFGSQAALREWPANVILVTCLAPGALRTRRGPMIRVDLLPDETILVDRLKKLMPRLKVLRVLWSSAFEETEVDDLADAAAARGVKVLSQRVPEPSRLPRSIRAFADSADALWLMPDPALVNAENFAVLREYAAATRTPFFAPTDGLAEKGATATLATSFRDAGRAAAAALKARLRGESERDHVHPDRIVVTVNAAAARAVGLDLGAASGVDRTIP
jgi:ABC-type uncharacterized transport system substrate-binding protein